MAQISKAGPRIQDLLGYVKTHPGVSFSDIGKNLGISHQRVAYLMKINAPKGVA